MLISFSGINNSGKSTQINLLIEYFSKMHFVVLTETPISSLIKRMDLFCILNGYSSFNTIFGYETIELSHAIDLLREIEVNYQQQIMSPSYLLLMEKYVPTWLAYADGHGVNNIYELLLIYQKFPLPNLHVHLELDPNIAIERMNNNPFEENTVSENPEFNLTFLKRYNLTLKNNLRKLNYPTIIVDANLEPDKVTKVILEQWQYIVSKEPMSSSWNP